MPSIKDKPLSAPRQSFVEFYADPNSKTFNNAAQSYKRAYPGTNSGYDAHGARLIGIDSIKRAINDYKVEIKQESIANRIKRQEFWTDTMDNAPNMCDRLRASELLGKSECDFVTVTRDETEKPTDLSQEDLAAANKLGDAAIGLKLAQ